jgi:hypothetical protein
MRFFREKMSNITPDPFPARSPVLTEVALTQSPRARNAGGF